MMVRPETIKMLIRVPFDPKQWIEAQAARNVSPQSSEVIRILIVTNDDVDSPVVLP